MLNRTIKHATADALAVLAAGLLGVFAGALLAEAALLVPYWRELAPQDFYRLHPVYAPRLFRFFAPLTIAVPLIAVCSAVVALVLRAPGRRYGVAAAVLSLTVVATYFVYFKQANDAFADRAVAEHALAGELARWAAWHRGRTGLACVAFALSLLALRARR